MVYQDVSSGYAKLKSYKMADKIMLNTRYKRISESLDSECVQYANRDTKQAEKCTVVDWVCQYPMAYIAKNNASGKIFKCYHDFGCFASKQEAYNDTQIEADRIIY